MSRNIKDIQIHKPDFIIPIRNFVEQLVAGSHEAVINMGFVKERLNADDIASEINSYPGQITSPSEAGYQDIEVYPYVNKSGFMLEFALWFDNEKSDLEIRVDVTEIEGKLHFTLWDILVP